MAAGYIGTSRVEAPHGGKRPLRPVSMLAPLGAIEDMIYPVPHQLGDRYSLFRSQGSQSEHLLFCKLYLSPNHR